MQGCTRTGRSVGTSVLVTGALESTESILEDEEMLVDSITTESCLTNTTLETLERHEHPTAQHTPSQAPTYNFDLEPGYCSTGLQAVIVAVGVGTGSCGTASRCCGH